MKSQLKIELLPADVFIHSDKTICPVCKNSDNKSMVPRDWDQNALEDVIGDDCVVLLPYQCNNCGIKIEMIYKLAGYRIPALGIKDVTE